MTLKSKVKTLKEARDYVFQVKICAVLSGKRKGLPSLWDAVDLPDKKPGEKGWGRKMEAVWAWKTELPARYPGEIFYGKIRGGTAVLMTMEYLKTKHYPENVTAVGDCSPLARKIYERVRLDRLGTTELRRQSMASFGCSKSFR
jgi:hypothetical protein